MPSDIHSVSLLPDFANVNNSLELSVYSDSLRCLWDNTIRTDILGHIRSVQTTMGAYERPPSGLDLMAWGAGLSDYEAINNQDISVNLDVINIGSVAINDATFGWSVNGQLQSTSVSHTFTPPLETYQQGNIPIGSFHADGDSSNMNVVVWVETINTIADSVKWNDTISTSAKLIPLVEFANPLVKDTISSLSFNVYATIVEKTGAPVSPPEIYIHTTIGECLDLRDTVPMTKEDGKWVANIPEQYFNSKVVYELHVSDNIIMLF